LCSLVLDDQKLTQWFLEHGAEPNAECGIDCTPLSLAICSATFPVIKMLFDRGGSVEHGQLIQYAAMRDEPDYHEIMDFLLDKGAPTDEVMYQNRLKDYFQLRAFGLGTPLHAAASEGKLDVVEHLLRRGADPLIKDARGKLAIERAERKGHNEVVELLRPLSTPSGPRNDFTDGPGIRFVP
jgi:ankyrin repeat protein